MANVTKEQVENIAHVARIAITNEEAAEYAKEFSDILAYAGQLNEVDTENVPPTTHVIDLKNVMREDIPEKGLSQEEVIKNAPDHLYGQIKVPSIID
mgnify:CR=1 FL=1